MALDRLDGSAAAGREAGHQATPDAPASAPDAQP